VRLDEISPPSTQWAAELSSASLELARRMAAGATLWCWAPRWPQHAEHLAVEFVHPVIVGARALPAEAVAGPEPLESLRAVVEPGDVLAVIGDAATPGVDEVLRHAPAWGVVTLWVGCGTRPRSGAADHLVWLETSEAEDPAFDGRLVLTYHVLWELTHVCFEHPGLLDDHRCDEADEDNPSRQAAGTHCVTCSDEGRLAEVVELTGVGGARVRTPAGIEDVDASLVIPVAPGDLVLVHAGVAISRLDGPERQAATT
jgi:hydrogenase maturation factor